MHKNLHTQTSDTNFRVSSWILTSRQGHRVTSRGNKVSRSDLSILPLIKQHKSKTNKTATMYKLILSAIPRHFILFGASYIYIKNAPKTIKPVSVSDVCGGGQERRERRGAGAGRDRRGAGAGREEGTGAGREIGAGRGQRDRGGERGQMNYPFP